MPKIKRIGLLTGGGDCPGLNAVIRAVVKKAINDFGLSVWGIEDGYEGLIEGRGRALRSDTVSNILPIGGTILGTSNTANPFAHSHDICGKVVTEDVSKHAVKVFEKWGLDALIAIGGDGTLTIANKFVKLGVPIIGIPKTIDNDLSATDITFGHDTAVQIISDAIDRLHTTAQSHHRVIVVEVMGRYVGWLALRGGLAGGGDVILIPEMPFTIEAAADEVKKRRARGKRFSIVVVSEGAVEKGGKMVVKKRIAGSPDPVRLGGIGERVACQIEERTGISSRVVVLGHLQRSGTPTAFDRILATKFGIAAVACIAAGHFGKMVALQGADIKEVDIGLAVRTLKKVPADGELIKAARSLGTTFGCS